jgi:hypothetical protein
MRAKILALALLLLACPQAQEPEPPAAPEAAEAATVPSATAPSGRPYSEVREACAARDATRNAYFGDFHVHTAFSMDAYTWDLRATPDDAYRFARGEELRLPPLDAQGNPTRAIRLERPLDFAAVTDHSEWLGEVSLCTRPGRPAYDTPACQVYRGEREPEVTGSPMGRMGQRAAALGSRGGVAVVDAGASKLDCGAGGATCLAAARSVWQEIQAATERAYDRSSQCRFTSFHGYEYSATPELSKVHHNVFFRNAQVPELPISWLDQPSVWGLWTELARQCLDAGSGCDAVTAPHNSNLSNGRMFFVDYRDLPAAQQVERAKLRARIETLVEITQIKGDSECRNGLYKVMGGSDEQCDFEKLWYGPEAPPDCEEGTGKGALAGQGCQSRLDFVRYALIEGLREAARIGTNPYKLGFIGSTDTHNANPGDTEESSFDGWAGISDDEPLERLAGGRRAIGSTGSNPGGLVGAWAEENSRDALFDAFQRRETFGTSGTRIQPRFFGGWSYEDGLCDDPELLAQAYAGGVPMGGDLPALPAAGGAPSFLVSAARDPGTATLLTNPLERIQIIKGWAGEGGEMHQAVYDVAGEKSAAGPDPASCEPPPGRGQLCAVWRDPAFDPAQRAVYYARVLEVPSCRWSTRQCNALPAEQRPPACSESGLPRTIQERAWTSPIWYEPTAPAAAVEP